MKLIDQVGSKLGRIMVQMSVFYTIDIRPCIRFPQIPLPTRYQERVILRRLQSPLLLLRLKMTVSHTFQNANLIFLSKNKLTNKKKILDLLGCVERTSGAVTANNTQRLRS